MTKIIRRIGLKLTSTVSMLKSVLGPPDWIPAIILSVTRTRPPRPGGWISLFSKSSPPMINIKPKLLRGLNVRVNLSDIANHTIYDEFFIDIIYDLSKLTFEPDLIIDCGAYHGYFSMLALAHFPATPSIAYEPSEANQNLLRANASMNHLEISIRQQAVSVEKGHRSFQEHGCGGQLSLDGAGARVEVVNLPFEIAQLNPQRLLLKLDVEGEENVIFPKLLPILPPTCAIFFEWHHGEELFLEAVQMFNDHGFGVKRQRTWFPRSDGVAFVDAVATRSQL